MAEMQEEFHGPLAMAMHCLDFLAFLAGISRCWLARVFYLKRPGIPAAIQKDSV